MDSNEVVLSKKEILGQIIKNSFQAVPVVGGVLAVAIDTYFGIKQENQLRRIEKFFVELIPDIEQLEDRMASLESHDKSKLVAIIEEFIEDLESYQSNQKLQYFKTYFKNTLIFPINENYDDRRFFLNSLNLITDLESDILISLNTHHNGYVYTNINDFMPNIEISRKIGAIGRLKNLGFLTSITPIPLTFSGEITIDDRQQRVKITDFGLSFVDFCIKEIE